MRATKPKNATASYFDRPRVKELERRLGVRVLTWEERRQELLASIADYERQHGCTSEEMRLALIAGTAEETIEAALWMFNYRHLLEMEGRLESVISTPSNAT